MCFRAWTVHRPSSKTREHKAVRRTRNAHLPLLDYICTCEHTCKHTSDSCLLSRMLNCPLAREHRGSRALKQRCLVWKISKHTSKLARGTFLEELDQATSQIDPRLCLSKSYNSPSECWNEKRHWSTLWNSLDFYLYWSLRGTCGHIYFPEY